MTDEEREDLNTFRHDLVKQARWWQWKAETLEKEKEQLKSENAALRERLGKAVELPCRVGTTVYGVGFFDCEDAYTEDKKKKREIFHHCMKMNGDCEKCKYRRPSIEEFVCTHIQIGACGLGGQKILIVGEKNENYTGENIYLTREAAEARLAELKGGKE